jgi:hypothetical protein
MSSYYTRSKLTTNGGRKTVTTQDQIKLVCENSYYTGSNLTGWGYMNSYYTRSKLNEGSMGIGEQLFLHTRSNKIGMRNSCYYQVHKIKSQWLGVGEKLIYKITENWFMRTVTTQDQSSMNVGEQLLHI